MGVDLVLVVPFCPQCHVAAACFARAIERRGLPTTSLTTLRRQAESVKPPRATFLDFPLGCPGGKPGKHNQQREIVRAALETGAAAPAEWDLHPLPFRWSEDGNRDWENLVVDLYRVENEIRGTATANIAANRSGLVAMSRSSRSAAPADPVLSHGDWSYARKSGISTYRDLYACER